MQDEPGYQTKWNPGDIQVKERVKENIPADRRFQVGRDAEGIHVYDLWQEEPKLRGFSGYPEALGKSDELNGKKNRYSGVEGPVL